MASTSNDREPPLYSLVQIQHLMKVEFSRAQRYGYPLLCLMLGVDGLERLREHRGYDAKQRVMDALIALVQGQTRCSDFVGRLSDDRLLVVVPHAKKEHAEVLPERLLQGCRDMELEADGVRLRITLSIGASWLVSGETLFFDDLLRWAEVALEEASAGGGDRCVTGGV
ncbi:MAG: GGDEF domain-containing protein [Planctomycetota bacterium]|jgi:diguanylate cyclase (GGDEF)-like protein|nr:GGDEF domain-containing protein [Planctomycetota bacterium]MDP6761503.1 GGDEF domain-containing protein [Planctomycetota bacterium]MDP6989486.1 GGDEF domain-containing protein [Planctomycetota bacterium]